MNIPSEYFCFNCGVAISVSTNKKISFSEECPKCHADLHVCSNCLHYDTNSYNDCRESQAERVLDKKKRNYCDYFSLGKHRIGQPNAGQSSQDDQKTKAKAKLDSLFKR